MNTQQRQYPWVYANIGEKENLYVVGEAFPIREDGEIDHDNPLSGQINPRDWWDEENDRDMLYFDILCEIGSPDGYHPSEVAPMIVEDHNAALTAAREQAQQQEHSNVSE